MPSRRVLTLVAGLLLAAGVHLGPVASPAAATSFVVSDGTEYAAALAAASVDTSGPHTISLDQDVTVTADPVYTGTQPLTLDGNGFTISGNDTFRILRSQLGTGAPALTITDITLRDAFSTTTGGAVSWGGPVTVSNGEFIDNRAVGTGVVAGAIDATDSIVVTDSSFVGNRARSTTGNSHGGAIVVDEDGEASIARSMFADNAATSNATEGSAGAIFAISSIEVTSSVFFDNAANGDQSGTGGALMSSGTVDITGSLLTENEASSEGIASAGAVYALEELVVTDSTLSDNRSTSTDSSADSSAAFSADITLTDTTVAGNVADGPSVAAGALAGSHLTATHATIAGNTGSPANLQINQDITLSGTVIGDGVGGANCAEPIGPITGTGSGADDDSCGVPNIGNILLGPPRDNGGPVAGRPGNEWKLPTMFPLAGSPVIDIANCGDGFDERGVGRPFGGLCDAGAVEGVYPPHGFTDAMAWVEDAIRWISSDVNDPPLMIGMSPTTFQGALDITRAQVVRMLYRLAGEPDVSGYPPHPFTDVPPWVEEAVRWAYTEEIATGYADDTFRPNDSITRAAVVRMVYRVAGSQDVAGIDPHGFVDVPAWVEDAVRWAANPDNPLPLITGLAGNRFAPNDDITRNQVVRMVWRLAITPLAWAEPLDAPPTVPFVPDDTTF